MQQQKFVAFGMNMQDTVQQPVYVGTLRNGKGAPERSRSRRAIRNVWMQHSEPLGRKRSGSGWDQLFE